MGSQKLLSVEQEFARKKPGRWQDRNGLFGQGAGYRIGGNIDVRCLRISPEGVLVQLSTFKHVELQGGQPAAEPDPEPPSEAQGIWLRTRLLTPDHCTLRIGQYVFAQVDCSVHTILFRLRQMAAMAVETVPDSDAA